MKLFIVINTATDMVMSQHNSEPDAIEAAVTLVAEHQQTYSVVETRELSVHKALPPKDAE